MYAENLNARLLAALDRPDLRVVSEAQRIRFDASLDTAFRADPGGEVVLGAACLGTARVCAFHIRHALELSMLLDAAEPAMLLDAAEPAMLLDAAPIAADPGSDALPAHERSILAGLCAARTAALFWHLDGPSDAGAAGSPPVSWLDAMAGENRPAAALLGSVWSRVRALQGPGARRSGSKRIDDNVVPSAVLDRLQSIWELLGPAEALMALGGDQRLAIDPRTGLNHYGCSHRPRPWAITFASSTASSLSERGFGGAEASRRRIAAAALGGHGREAAQHEARAVRQGIAAHYGLLPGCDVVLAASGTDCELIALALAEAGGPVSSILTAPEETGTGVPLAAGGKHFASDTSGRQQVSKGGLVAGFRPDTRVLPLAIRNADGSLRTVAEVDAQCASMVAAETQAGRQVLLHLLDLSKTGLLAPSVACIEQLRERHGASVHVVVDACQARLDASRVRDYLARGWMVMITGSKFFTGPPFCGAVLLPREIASGLAAGGLPAGLAAYCGKADWPDRLAAALPLPDWVNLGLVLRWHAALAEMQAFGAVPAAQVRERLTCFLGEVRRAIGLHPHLRMIEVPDPKRPPAGSWDELQTILSFLVLEPGQEQASEAALPLDLQRARLLYRWLNADVSPALPDASEAERRLAGLLCHIGQPVPVLHTALGGRPAGALRISAGARLLSGEPSHAGMDVPRRLAREIADVRLVLDKITLLLRHWDALQKHDPEPSYAACCVRSGQGSALDPLKAEP